MKKAITLLFTLFTVLSFGQNSFHLDRNGTDTLVVEVKNMNADVLYTKAYNWVLKSYKNPDEVIKSKIENKYLRFEGYCKECWSYRNYMFNATYTMTFEFKDGKYRVYANINELTASGMVIYHSYEGFFKKDGSVKKPYEKSLEDLKNYLTNLNITILKDIKSEDKGGGDW